MKRRQEELRIEKKRKKKNRTGFPSSRSFWRKWTDVPFSQAQICDLGIKRGNTIIRIEFLPSVNGSTSTYKKRVHWIINFISHSIHTVLVKLYLLLLGEYLPAPIQVIILDLWRLDWRPFFIRKTVDMFVPIRTILALKTCDFS